MIQAVYVKREDGDWDFVAAFESESVWNQDENLADKFAQNLQVEGEEVLVKNFDHFADLTDVLNGDTK